MKNSLKLICLVFCLLVLTQCATKKGTIQNNEFSPSTENEPTEPTQQEPLPDTPPKPRIALVLGGAGVASFATVGLLKKFEEEGIEIAYIVTTGWPTLYALGYGFFNSIHDLEWFAMRLEEKQLYDTGLFDFNRGYAAHERLVKLAEKHFKKRDLRQTRVPVVISTNPLGSVDPEIASRGNWKRPLLRAMSVPGFYRPFPGGRTPSIHSLRGVDVQTALEVDVDMVVAVDMYQDYLKFLKKPTRKASSETTYRQLYVTWFEQNLNQQLKLAPIRGKISLGRSPTDFKSKRRAIRSGYLEATRLAKEVWKNFNQPKDLPE